MRDYSKQCSYSGYVFERGDLPVIEVARVSPKEKIHYMAAGVVCPKCGRELVFRNHPMTSTRKMLPIHNKP